MTATTAVYAVVVPTVIASAATRPPTAKLALRNAPRKPNQRSRSPGGEMVATTGLNELQNAVWPSWTTAEAASTEPNESAKTYPTKPVACTRLAASRTRLAPIRSTRLPKTGASGSCSADAIDNARPI